jgi:hypothetical protein
MWAPRVPPHKHVCHAIVCTQVLSCRDVHALHHHRIPVQYLYQYIITRHACGGICKGPALHLRPSIGSARGCRKPARARLPSHPQPHRLVGRWRPSKSKCTENSEVYAAGHHSMVTASSSSTYEWWGAIAHHDHHGMTLHRDGKAVSPASRHLLVGWLLSSNGRLVRSLLARFDAAARLSRA